MAIPTRYINAGPLAAQASAGPAMAAGEATAQVGQAIQNVGEMGLEIATRTRKIKETGAISAFMAQADEEAGRFAIDLAKRSDTDAWPSEWRDRTTDLRERAKSLGLSPDGQAVLDNQFTDWSSTRSIHFETQAATKALGIARGQTTQSLQYYASRGDTEGFNRTLGTAKSGGLLTPDEVSKAEMEFKGITAGLDMDKMVQGNPQSVIDTPTDEFLKRVPGLTIDMVERGKREAKAMVKERSLDTVEAAQDAIYSGKLTDPAQLDTDPAYATMRPMVRERLKQGLKEYQTEKAYGLMNTPEAQAQVVGKVSGLLAGWEPKAAEDADVKYAEIQGQIGRLPDGPIKDELVRQSKAIRTGAWANATTHAEAASKSLDAAYKDGRFGRVPEVSKITTAAVVKAGFLKDTAKLQRLGFSDAQAADILEASADPAIGQRKFIELWSERPGGSVKASGPEIEAANALRLGHAETPWNDPESEDAVISAKLGAEKRYGEAKMKLSEFIKINPKATPEQIDGKILEISGEQTHRELKSGIYDGKKATSGGPAGASDSTAALPVGKDLTEIVKNFEAGSGFHAKAYWDYGQWSIGYGTKAKEGETITQAEADTRLSKELGSHRARVETAVAKTGLKFTPAQLDALTSFDFNTGKVETLLANGTRTKQEIADMMLLYRNAGGERLRGLENRRRAERHLFLHGHANQPTATAANDGEFSEFNVIQ